MAAVESIRRRIRPLAVEMRVSVPFESSAQSDPYPSATAITGEPIRIERSTFRCARSSLTTRLSSLHASQPVVPETASVSVGQKGPAAAQVLNAGTPGRRPGAGRSPARGDAANAATRSTTALRTTVGCLARERRPWDDYR